VGVRQGKCLPQFIDLVDRVVPERIVSTDADFYELATTIGPPTKVIWLRRWMHPTNDAEDLLRRSALHIAEFERDPELGILIFDKK